MLQDITSKTPKVANIAALSRDGYPWNWRITHVNYALSRAHIRSSVGGRVAVVPFRDIVRLYDDSEYTVVDNRVDY